jgi:hypothetical protein
MLAEEPTRTLCEGQLIESLRISRHTLIAPQLQQLLKTRGVSLLGEVGFRLLAPQSGLLAFDHPAKVEREIGLVRVAGAAAEG